MTRIQIALALVFSLMFLGLGLLYNPACLSVLSLGFMNAVFFVVLPLAMGLASTGLISDVLALTSGKDRYPKAKLMNEWGDRIDASWTVRFLIVHPFSFAIPAAIFYLGYIGQSECVDLASMIEVFDFG